MSWRKQDIRNKKTQKAYNYWYSLKPIQRSNLMKEANLTQRTMTGKFRAVIDYIKQNKI